MAATLLGAGDPPGAVGCRAWTRSQHSSPRLTTPSRGPAPPPPPGPIRTLIASRSRSEYSRCLDPGKYQILAARVDAWVDVLTARGMAHAEEVPASTWAGVRRADRPERMLRVTPRAPGAVRLLVAPNVVDGGPFGIEVGVETEADGTVLIDLLPGCGCDACDDGSAPLLEMLDERILAVLSGGVTHARSGSSSATRNRDGWRAGGDADPDAWLDPAREVPGVTRWIGPAWWPA
ncbi:MAG: DUF6226 family protein [Nocardioides sp.]|uniref:DUF6226 family protein n=1 Tax=Nocardioides sp. TaxID=35761 RepID=UPI0039E55AF5